MNDIGEFAPALFVFRIIKKKDLVQIYSIRDCTKLVFHLLDNENGHT